MAADPRRETFRIDLEALPSATPAAVRIRAMLKRCLRSFDLKALRVEQLQGGSAQAQAPDAPEIDHHDMA